MRTYTNKRRLAGFTLIEVMITVAIVAILAAIAYPGYSSYIQKGKRATAQAALMELASKQQTYLLDRRLYSSSLTDLAFAAPKEIENDYTFSATKADGPPPTFTVTATPSAALQAKGEKTLTINQAGSKTPSDTVGYWGQ